MVRIKKSIQTGLLLFAGALFAVAAPAAAQSIGENAQIMNRINQLDNQIQTLSRAYYRGEKPSSRNMPSGAGGSVAEFDARLSQIEEKQRMLTGQIEKLVFEQQQLKTRLDRLQVDTEQRFQQQGGQPTSLAPVPSAPTPMPANQLGTLSSPSEGSAGPAEAMYEKSFAAVRDGKYEEAESGFKGFLAQYPGHPLTANAQYWLGETYYVRGDFRQAAKTFAQCYQGYPQSAKAHDSLLKLGLSLSKLGKKEDACLSLKQLEKEVTDDGSPLRRKAVVEIKQLGCQ